MIAEQVPQPAEHIGFDIADAGNEFAVKYSTGMKKKLALGMATIHQPKLLILDEPTAGMSIPDKPGMVELIRKVSRERGVTVILIEHDMDIVFSVADEITVLHQGAVVAQGTPQEIKSNEQVQQIYLGEDADA